MVDHRSILKREGRCNLEKSLHIPSIHRLEERTTLSLAGHLAQSGELVGAAGVVHGHVLLQPEAVLPGVGPHYVGHPVRGLERGAVRPEQLVGAELLDVAADPVRVQQADPHLGREVGYKGVVCSTVQQAASMCNMARKDQP